MADVGAGLDIGVGEGNLLRVAEDPEEDPAGTALGTAPEVEAVGEEGVVLGFDEDEYEERRAALAEVFAFGIFTFAVGTVAVVGEGLAEVVAVCRG